MDTELNDIPTSLSERDYRLKNIDDVVSAIGELEHLQRHALKSACVATRNDQTSVKYFLLALSAKQARRELMEKHFGNVDDKDWCIIKVAATLRQLAYETFEQDDENLVALDTVANEALQVALGVDLSGCKACAEDRETTLARLAGREAEPQSH